MRWLARLKPLAAVAAALILATAGVAVQGRQQPAPGGVREQAKTAAPPKAGAGGAAAVPDIAANRALAREQLALIDRAMESLLQEYRFPRAGQTISTYPSLSVWERRKMEALHRTGAGKAEIVAALEKLIDTLKQQEAIAENRHQIARGTLYEVLDVRFRRLEAEIWLNEDKAR